MPTALCGACTSTLRVCVCVFGFPPRTPNLARQLDRWDSKSDFTQIHHAIPPTGRGLVTTQTASL